MPQVYSSFVPIDQNRSQWSHRGGSSMGHLKLDVHLAVNAKCVKQIQDVKQYCTDNTGNFANRWHLILCIWSSFTFFFNDAKAGQVAIL